MTMRARILMMAAVAALAATFAACGGEDGPKGAPGTASNPLPGKVQDSSAPSGGRTNEGSSSGAKAEQPGYQALVEEQDRDPRSRFTPCNLVTKAQARTILGTPILEPAEGAQGPTCIYRSEDGKAFVTLAIQPVKRSQIEKRLQQARRLAVADRTAYCGQYGQEMLYLPLADGRALAVGAPCGVAKRFAERAVREL
jgi:hypothetical protein